MAKPTAGAESTPTPVHRIVPLRFGVYWFGDGIAVACVCNCNMRRLASQSMRATGCDPRVPGMRHPANPHPKEGPGVTSKRIRKFFCVG